MLLGLQVEDPVWKTVLTLKTDDEGCAMMDNIDEVTDKRLKALKEIEKDKLRVARAYNKKVKANLFRLVSWFGRQYCLLRQRATNSASGRQVGKDRTRL